MDNRCFDSPDAYQQDFVAGLREMLAGYDELGVFILVLANAMLDPAIWAQLDRPLRIKFERLAAVHDAGRQGLSLDDARDDQLVFAQLLEIGIDDIGPIRLRQCGPWELQFNPLRSLRPPRMMNGRTSGISAPFNPDQFHFARPFLRKEIFWNGKLGGRPCALLYNKFPFVRMMGLLVPEIRAGHPQYLHAADHAALWQVLEQLEKSLPDIGIGFNSYGAYASVNHLHFHLFQHNRPFPVSASEWRHNGGAVDYPAPCQRFDSRDEAWQFIQDLHGRKTPYNLLALPGRLYCWPRISQGSRTLPDWSGGYGWYEMAGCCVPQGEAAFAQLTEAELADELRAVSAH